MSELKPCPFCGSKALTNIFLDCEDIENLPTNVIDDYEPEVTCENERCIYGWWLSPKDWNTRPIEDALNARIAELEAVQRWIPVEERLPDGGHREFYEVACIYQDFGELALFSKGRWVIYEGENVYNVTEQVKFWRKRQYLPDEVIAILSKGKAKPEVQE